MIGCFFRTDVNISSSRIISGPDRTREQGETNVVVPVEPIARIEPIDQPADAEGMSPAGWRGWFFFIRYILQGSQCLEPADAQRIAPDEPECISNWQRATEHVV
jgi:hypothetical protein